MEAKPTNNQNHQENQSIQPQIDQSIENPNKQDDSHTKLPELPKDKFESFTKTITQIPTIITTTTTTTKDSNKKLIQFLFSLSNLIFFGGSLTGLIILIYQKYIFPKLKIKTEIIRLLNLSTSKSYDKILGKLNELVHSNLDLYQSPFIKVFLNKSIKVKSINDQTIDKLNLNSNQTIQEKKSESINKTESTWSDSIIENELNNSVQTSKNHTIDSNLEMMKSNLSSSVSIASDHQIQLKTELNPLEGSNRKQFNKPIINYLEQISIKLRKREKPTIEILESSESIRSDDIIESENLSTPTLNSNLISMTIKNLKSSIKAIEDELSNQSEQIVFINQKLSSSHHLNSYGLNQWSTYSSSLQSIDNDTYFIALNQFKSQIRELKGTLLNRKRFY